MTEWRTNWKSENLMDRIKIGSEVKEESNVRYFDLTRILSVEFSIRTEISPEDPQHFSLLDMFEGATDKDFEALGRKIFETYVEAKTRTL